MDTYTASNGITVSVHRKQPHLGYALYGPDGTNTLDLGFSHLDTVEMDALREFFQHEATHKPWHAAKEGELWALTVDGKTFVARVGEDDGLFFQDIDRETFTVDLTDYEITAARRIWPEGDPS